MVGLVSFAMRVLEQNEATGRDMPPVSVTGLVFGRSIKPHCEHVPWNSVPIDPSGARRDAREADVRRWATRIDILACAANR